MGPPPAARWPIRRVGPCCLFLALAAPASRALARDRRRRPGRPRFPRFTAPAALTARVPIYPALARMAPDWAWSLCLYLCGDCGLLGRGGWVFNSRLPEVELIIFLVFLTTGDARAAEQKHRQTARSSFSHCRAGGSTGPGLERCVPIKQSAHRAIERSVTPVNTDGYWRADV